MYSVISRVVSLATLVGLAGCGEAASVGRANDATAADLSADTAADTSASPDSDLQAGDTVPADQTVDLESDATVDAADSANTDGWGDDCIVGLPCDDFDPCTQQDSCVQGICKGIAIDCSDGETCTIDRCQLDGTCTNKPNQHWECTPDIVIDFPPRGFASQDPANSLTVQGHLVPVNAATQPITSVTVQGISVPVNNNQFSATVPLQPGLQRLTVELADKFGNTRKAIQGVHHASQWRIGDTAVAAGAVGLGQKLVTASGLQGPAPWIALLQPQLADLGFAAQLPNTGAPLPAPVPFGLLVGEPAFTSPFALALPLFTAPLPTAATATTAQEPTVPLFHPCTATDWALGGDNSGYRWSVSADALNVALYNAFVAGALQDDTTSLTPLLGVPIPMLSGLTGTAPWRLSGCGDQWTLHMADLRLTADAALPELPLSAVTWLALEVPAKFVVQSGHLELWLGDNAQFWIEIQSIPALYFYTDFHVGTEDILLKKVLPVLVESWKKAPLLRVALPGIAAGKVTLGQGVVGVE